MAVESTMLELGTQAPAFNLLDVVSGKRVSLEDYLAKPLLLMFICTHCPYVKHVEAELARLGQDYGTQVAMLALCANDVSTHPQDAPEGLKEQALRVGFSFPYLYDETQEVAKAYTAACTPDFFLFDAGHKLVYRGRMDASRPNSGIAVSAEELRAAMDALLSGKSVAEEQYPSMGCNIKWKAGNEPSYYG